MKDIFCNGSKTKDRWAVSLCYSAATLLGLEALHPGACAGLGLDAEQSFVLSAVLATLSIFLGTFIQSRSE